MNIGKLQEREDEKATCILIKMKELVGHSNKGGRGKNGKDKKNKTNLMIQLPLTFIPWYVQFGRLATYK